MVNARGSHTATLLNSWNVLIARDRDTTAGGGIATAELYDPATGTFSSTASMSNSRHFHTATLLNNGKVLTAGGIEGGGVFLATAELY